MILALLESKTASSRFDEEGDCRSEVKSYTLNRSCVEIMHMMNELIWKLPNLK